MSQALKGRLIFAAMMSLLVSFLMSGWLTWLTLGLPADFLPRWMRAFAAAWPAAFAIVVAFGPTVQKASQQVLQAVASQES